MILTLVTHCVYHVNGNVHSKIGTPPNAFVYVSEVNSSECRYLVPVYWILASVRKLCVYIQKTRIL